jgi:hypothetical protein
VITPRIIGPAEYIGEAQITDGHIDVGGLRVPFDLAGDHVGVYVRRLSDNGDVAEIALAAHDGLAFESEGQP